jgi:hypothetical protein
MSTEDPPNPKPPGSAPPPADWQRSQGEWYKFAEMRDELAAQKGMSASLASKLAAAEAAAAAAKTEADTVRTRASLDIALVRRLGLTDPEDLAEFADRYARAPAGEDGKKPTPDAWAAAIKAAPPKWARAYIETTPAPPKVDPPRGETEEPPADAQAEEPPPADPPKVEAPKAPPRNPNAGAVVTPGTTPRRYSETVVAKMSASEVAKNAAAIARDAIADGDIYISPELQKSLGISTS